MRTWTATYTPHHGMTVNQGDVVLTGYRFRDGRCICKRCAAVNPQFRALADAALGVDNYDESPRYWVCFNCNKRIDITHNSLLLQGASA